MCFEKMLWSIPKWWMVDLWNIVLPENLLGITGALGMKESHFLSKNVFWGNVLEYHRNGEW